MKILGISCFFHDSAASLIVDGEIIAAVQEERFTRNKHTPDFPINSILFCLEQGGYKINELDSIVFYDKPIVKFERLLSTFYAVSPKGLLPFLKSMPIWLKEKLFLKKVIYDNLKQIDSSIRRKDLNILFTEHHISHGASCFYPSNFNESAIITIDGVGEWTTTSIAYGYQNKIKILKELHFPNSVGLLYSAFTFYLGFKVNSGEYKLMGLAPYGNENSIETKKFIKKIKENLVDIKQDGSIFLNQSYFNYTFGLKMINDKKFEDLFGLSRRNPNDEITQTHCNLALAIQRVTEDIIIKIAYEAKRLTNSENLCLAGGVALNCVANGKIEEKEIFKNIYIQPAAGDAGGSLGAALAIYHMFYEKSRTINEYYDKMQGAYLGPFFSEKEIMIMNKKFKANYSRYDSMSDLTERTAKLIAEGNVIGWFQGKSEFGPRALGNRSILADPRDEEMQKKLNLKIKYREGFRPFAPSVIEEDYSKFFEGNSTNPYMLLVKNVKPEIIEDVPKKYFQLFFREKLYTKRSKLQSITHVDFSARIQAVSKQTNEKFWMLLNEFKKITGMGVLINTSFNVRGEPIVNSPTDAFKCFMNTEMDYLVIENYLYSKKNQKIKLKKIEFEKD
tara:strand:+ start:111 stop:1964 length:1854 start_codon:yes stop_codon:yes gene_type:complete